MSRSNAHEDGQRHAATHDTRPCLAALESEWGYSPFDALQFALGFFEAKREAGEEAFVECRCREGPKASCNWLAPDWGSHTRVT